MTNAETDEVLAILRAAYPDHHPTDATIATFTNSFHAEPVDVVKHAARKWIADQHGRWPTPADLRDTARSQVRGQARDRSYTSRRDPKDPQVAPPRGRQIAANAYRADCEARGIELNSDIMRRLTGEE